MINLLLDIWEANVFIFKAMFWIVGCIAPITIVCISIFYLIGDILGVDLTSHKRATQQDNNNSALIILVALPLWLIFIYLL